MNYRSVVLFGRGEVIDDPAEKFEAMRVFTEKILPGRWDDARLPTDKEFRGTLMVSVPIDVASAKTRVGPPVDDDEDMDMDIWAGVIPYRLAPGTPIPDPDMEADTPFPSYLHHLLD